MKLLINLIIAFLLMNILQAQNVGIGTTTPAASAKLDISSATQGFLAPRMTAADRKAIAAPAEGLMVYQTDVPAGFYYSKNNVWTRLMDASTLPGLAVCNQQWMDRNLDVTNYGNGDAIPYVTEPAVWNTLATGAWCYYNNDPSTLATYGRLYNWYAATDSRGLAPAGWHIPGDGEWDALVSCLGGETLAGGKMKITGIEHWQTPNTGATNSSGFSALPSGLRNADGSFFNGGNIAGWWSTNANSAVEGRSRNIAYYDTQILNLSFEKKLGLAIRCIKD